MNRGEDLFKDSKFKDRRRASAKWDPQIFEDKRPWRQMGREHMQSVLVVEYMKFVQGKTSKGQVDSLLDLR